MYLIAAALVLLCVPLWLIGSNLGALGDQANNISSGLQTAAYRTTCAVDHLSQTHGRLVGALEAIARSHAHLASNHESLAMATIRNADSAAEAREKAGELLDVLAPFALDALGIEQPAEPPLSGATCSGFAFGMPVEFVVTMGPADADRG